MSTTPEADVVFAEFDPAMFGLTEPEPEPEPTPEPEQAPADGDGQADDVIDSQDDDGQEETVPLDMALVTRAAAELGLMKALHKEIGDEIKKREEEYAPYMAAAVNAGLPRQFPLRGPDGTQYGNYNVKAVKSEFVFDEPALLAYTEQRAPDNIAETLDERALTDPDVIEYVRLVAPHLIRRSVRASYRKLLAELADEKGHVPDANGELVKIGKRVRVESDGTGSPSWKPGKNGAAGGRTRIVDDWRTGRLQGPPMITPPKPEPDRC